MLMNIRKGFKFIIFAALISCGASKENAPEKDVAVFTSNFDQGSSFSDLFPADLRGWTNVQCVDSEGAQSSDISGLGVLQGENGIQIDTNRSVSGTNSLRFEAPPSQSSVSKAAIVKEGVDFVPGDKIRVKFKVFLEANGSAKNLFILDFESTELQGYPGRRIAISSSEELMLESKNAGKAYGSGPNFYQSTSNKRAIPKDKWVSIEVSLLLSRDSTGHAQIWQDGVLVLDATGQTFPSEADIHHYNWIEFGITANSSANSQKMWMDDVEMQKE